jgi:hypothetical protein
MRRRAVFQRSSTRPLMFCLTVIAHECVADQEGASPVSGGSAIRGSRVGAGPMGEAERGETAPRQHVSFWCANGHETRPSFALDVVPPPSWDCPRCGLPAGRDRENVPEPPRIEPYKTHMAYVRERRSDADGEAILQEALQRLHDE